MLKGPLAKSIFLFTIPIAVGSIIQQLFNSADTWVVGFSAHQTPLPRWVQTAEIIAMIVTVSSGLSVGANIAAAKCIGKGKKHELPFVSAGRFCLPPSSGLPCAAARAEAVSPLLNIIKVRTAYFHRLKNICKFIFSRLSLFAFIRFLRRNTEAIGSFGSGFLLCEHFVRPWSTPSAPPQLRGARWPSISNILFTT